MWFFNYPGYYSLLVAQPVAFLTILVAGHTEIMGYLNTHYPDLFYLFLFCNSLLFSSSLILLAKNFGTCETCIFVPRLFLLCFFNYHRHLSRRRPWWLYFHTICCMFCWIITLFVPTLEKININVKRVRGSHTILFRFFFKVWIMIVFKVFNVS